MKCFWHWFGFKDSDCGGQGTIEGATKVICWDRCLQYTTGDLAQSMNSGVGATLSLGQGTLPDRSSQCGLQFTLNRAFAGLNLPTAVVRAVIGQGKLPVFNHWHDFG